MNEIDMRAVDYEEVQKLFDFAWDNTAYRANLVALRQALRISHKIKLPCDVALEDFVETIDQWVSENRERSLKDA